MFRRRESENWKLIFTLRLLFRRLETLASTIAARYIDYRRGGGARQYGSRNRARQAHHEQHFEECTLQQQLDATAGVHDNKVMH